MGVTSLTWDQVNAWRLSQHCLSPRLSRHDFAEAVTRTGGIQAQVMSAAEMAIGVRVDGLTRLDVQSALWEDRTLVKTWAMRGTLHLLAAVDLPLFVAARSAQRGRDWSKYFTYFGFTPAQSEAFMAAVPQMLGSEPVTREEFATAVAEHIGAPEVARILLSSSWGSLWKPSAWRGDLCFGPNQDRNVTFVHPGKWIGRVPAQAGDAAQGGQPVEPYQALQEMARRYLRAYGPATPEEFAHWWELGLVSTKKLFKSLEDELEPVDLEGRRALALRATIEPMQKLETPEAVHLLPLFDAYTLGIGRDIEPILPREYKSRVYRPQGWISAVVLAGGRMKGVWEHKTQGAQTLLKVHMFSSPTASVRRGIEAEAGRLNSFLDTEVVLEVGTRQ